MYKNIVRLVGKISIAVLLFFPSIAIAQSRTPEWVYYCPEETINGIRYWKVSRLIDEVRDFPWLRSLRDIGFTVNPNDSNTYIAPDGKVVPRIIEALIVVPPNKINGGEQPPADASAWYFWDIYLLDSIEGFHGREDLYVLDFPGSSMSKGLFSIRTPLYVPITDDLFQKAVDLKKVQIGACYSVQPNAFMKCGKLETVIFEQAPCIYENAFINCKAISNVVLQSATELPILDAATAFEDCVYMNATLYIADNLMEACKQHPIWSKFGSIKSLNECNVEIMKP